MRSKGTWVFVFYVAATALVAMVLSLATQELFGLFRVYDVGILGPSVTLSNVVGLGVALLIAIFTGFLYKKPRHFIEECIEQLEKTAWPSGHETKVATYTVIVVSLIAALILGFFDSIFGWLSHHDFFLG